MNNQISIELSKATALIQALNISVLSCQNTEDRNNVLNSYNALIKELGAIGQSLAIAFNFETSN